ncbi:MAG: AlpA family phage regulatory protein [Pseudomonadota bacterium]
MSELSGINMSKDALRIRQVVDLLPFSRTTFYRMRAAGEFPKPFLIRGIEFWLRDDVEKWKAEVLETRKEHAA